MENRLHSVIEKGGGRKSKDRFYNTYQYVIPKICLSTDILPQGGLVRVNAATGEIIVINATLTSYSPPPG